MDRVGLTKIIHTRLGGTVTFRKIYQAISVIIDQISNDIVNDQIVTVRRFGTFSPHVRREHAAYNVSTGTIRKLGSKRSVKFHPHEAFKMLIRERQERFRQKSQINLD